MLFLSIYSLSYSFDQVQRKGSKMIEKLLHSKRKFRTSCVILSQYWSRQKLQENHGCFYLSISAMSLHSFYLTVSDNLSNTLEKIIPTFNFGRTEPSYKTLFHTNLMTGKSDTSKVGQLWTSRVCSIVSAVVFSAWWLWNGK